MDGIMRVSKLTCHAKVAVGIRTVEAFRARASRRTHRGQFPLFRVKRCDRGLRQHEPIHYLCCASLSRPAMSAARKLPEACALLPGDLPSERATTICRVDARDSLISIEVSGGAAVPTPLSGLATAAGWLSRGPSMQGANWQSPQRDHRPSKRTIPIARRCPPRAICAFRLRR